MLLSRKMMNEKKKKIFGAFGSLLRWEWRDAIEDEALVNLGVTPSNSSQLYPYLIRIKICSASFLNFD